LLISQKRIFPKEQEMPPIVQWTSAVNNGFGINPPDVKVVSKEEFDTTLASRVNMLASAANARRAKGQPPIWCDDSVIMVMKDERSITEHMIVVAETDQGEAVAAGSQVLGQIKGILTMGNDKDRDPPSVLTIHGACAKTPDYLNLLLHTVVDKNRLKTYGVTQVKATIFSNEFVVYARNGFRAVPGGSATMDVVLDVASLGGGRRKSRTMRSKRKRSTRRNRIKQ
jgi:hypothetical protein